MINNNGKFSYKKDPRQWESDDSDSGNLSKEESQQSTHNIQKKRINKWGEKKLSKKESKSKCQLKKIAYQEVSINPSELSQNQIKFQFETSLLSQVPFQKVFFLAGDILAELKDATNEMGMDILIEQRNSIFIEKDNLGTQFELVTLNPLKNFQQVIHYQENSQDKELYEFSQSLKKHQELIYMLNAQIQDLKNSYSFNDDKLQEIINQRQKIKHQQRKEILKQIYDSDQFCQIGTLGMSLSNQTTTISNICFSQSMTALLGFEYGNIIYNISRIAFFKIFSQNARRQLMKFNMLAQQSSQSLLQFEINDFEIITIDEIKIICKCKFSKMPIAYPPDLQLEKYPLINQIEQLCVIQYEITPWHIEQVLKIRKGYFKQGPQTQIFPYNYQLSNLIEIENFEYNIQSQIFLEKYYQKELEKMKKENEKKVESQQIEIEYFNLNQQPCGYRYI